MPGFSGRADLAAEAAAGKIDSAIFSRLGLGNATTGIWQSQWTAIGIPATGSNPAATPGTIYTSDQTAAVTGAMWFPDRSTDKRFLLSFGALFTTGDPGTLMVYDRLAGVSGISVATTGSKTVNSGALDRYTGTDAINNEVWYEVTTATLTTAPIVNLLTYTSADGTTGNVGGSVTFPLAATPSGCMVQLPLKASVRGVRSVETLNVATASSSGSGNIVILRVLARIPIGPSNRYNEVNFLDDILALPQVFDNATLAFAYLPSLTQSAALQGSVTCVYG